MIPNDAIDYKTPRRSKPQLDYQRLNQYAEEKVNTIINKCSDIHENLSKTYNLLKNKPKIKIPEPDNSTLFMKSPSFKLEKIKFNAKDKIRIEAQNFNKLYKLKSIILSNSNQKHDLLSLEDVQSIDAVEFLRLNKRKFGECSLSQEIIYNQPSKSKEKLTKVNPTETVLNNIKNILHPIDVKPYKPISKSERFLEKVLLNVQEHTPTNKLVKNEMKKL